MLSSHADFFFLLSIWRRRAPLQGYTMHLKRPQHVLYCQFLYLPVCGGVFLLLPTRKSSFLPLFSSTDEKFWDWVSLGLGRSIGCECNKGLMKRGQRTVCTCGTRSTSKTQFLHFLPFGSVSALYVMGGLALPCRHVYVKSTAFPLFLVCIWPKPLKSYELGQALLFTSAPCGNCSYIYNLLSPLTQYKITTY